MILKVALVQPVYDYNRQDVYQPKEGLNKKKVTSFANVLENVMQSKTIRK